MFYTYIHYRASDRKPFYVGKGKGERAYSHLGRNAYWDRVKKKHGVEVEIAARWSDEDSAFTHEKFLIGCFRDMGFKLANLTDGGEGGSGVSPSAETRAKLSAKNKGRKMAAWFAPYLSSLLKGRPKSEEHKRKLAEVNRGKTYGAETIAKRVAHIKGKKQSPEHLAKRSAALMGMAIGGKGYRAIHVLCVETGVVYAAMSEAEWWLKSIGHTTASNRRISECCAGKRETAYGYHWKRVEKEADMPITKH
jgi:hypothetical protein